MERIIEVSIFSFSLTHRSNLFITSYCEYDIKCDILSSSFGVLQDHYVLRLTGNEKDIQRYLDYLHDVGFKIRIAQP